MTKEELIAFAKSQTLDSFDKDIVAKWLGENFPEKEKDISFLFYDKIQEMSKMLDLVEAISAKSKATDSEESFDDSINALVYSIAVIESKKYKIDILKVAEEFGIEKLYKKYVKEEENGQ